MEDNNNLEDFFRKRLQSFDEEDASWFNPDANTDKLVLGQLMEKSDQKANKSKLFARVLLCLLLLLLLGYIGKLKYDVYQLQQYSTPNLKATTAPKSTNIANTLSNNNFNTNTSNNTNNNSTNNTHNSSDENNPKTVLTQANFNQIQKENQQLKSLLAQQRKEILSLKNQLDNIDCNKINTDFNFATTQQTSELDKQSGAPVIVLPNETNVEDKDSKDVLTEEQNIVDKNPNDEFSNELAATLNELAVLHPKLLANPLNNEPIEEYAAFEIKKKRRRYSIELGLELGLQAMFTKIDRTIPTQRIIADNSATETVTMPMQGLTLGYSPFKNFWIHGSFHFGMVFNNINHKMGVVYDDNKQYQLPNGDLANDFSLYTQTGYTSNSNMLQLLIPQTTQKGDLLEFDLNQQLDITRLKVPLSISYMVGNKKWQPVFQSGIQWNLLKYTYQLTSLDIKNDNQFIKYNETSNGVTEVNESFVSLFTGIGLNWNIKHQWTMRGMVTYEKNFMIKGNDNRFEDSYNGFAFRLGFYYRL